MTMGPLRTFYRYLLHFFNRLLNTLTYCYRFFRGLRIELWHVNGGEVHSHLPLSVLCALPKQEKSHMLRLMFGESFRERSLGRIWSWSIARAAAKAGVDYSVILAHVDKPRFQSAVEKELAE